VRLRDSEKSAIKECFLSVFEEGKISLFGSRVIDTELGGDIDLFLEVVNHENLFEKKIRFLGKLKSKIGEQRIDLVVAEDGNRLIEKEARKWAIPL
jgi:hypothetical protein